MVVHVFIAPIKEGISEQLVNQKITEMKELKNQIPEIIDLKIGRNTGWMGIDNAITMIIQVKNKEDWQTFLDNPHHVQLGAEADDTFDTERFVVCQFEM